MRYFLQDDGAVRTQNPHEANLFFIPALVREGCVGRGEGGGAACL